MKTQVILSLRKMPVGPVEAESINPEGVTGKDKQEIEALPLLVGNRWEKAGDYFDVAITALEGFKEESGAGSPADLILQGDLSRFKRLGEGMTAGQMVVEGTAGFHAGAFMSGGTLTIQGNAGDWLGAHMRGGKIVVRGGAGHFIGAAYRGYKLGMTGGTILVAGDVGQMVGARLRRGVIAIGGNCGDMPGFAMGAGTIVIAGTAGLRAGAKMVRGTLILLRPSELLPTFYYNCVYQPPFWGLLYSYLAGEGFELPACSRASDFVRYSGDANEGGRGEILLCQSHA
ncbi:MAG: formylmethanofuran dehydrogenase subunit C [Negativicutes bacterium]|nr:formylmethanofuran dehydrogenase subunit C [Negativicutes bacterium]